MFEICLKLYFVSFVEKCDYFLLTNMSYMDPSVFDPSDDLFESQVEVPSEEGSDDREIEDAEQKEEKQPER